MSQGYALVADIGGTNARFALTDLSAPEISLSAQLSLPNADFASLRQAASHYLAGIGVRPRVAAIAVASPVGRDEIRLTNRAWSFSVSALQEELGLDQLSLLNDFGAVAWAVPALPVEAITTLHGAHEVPQKGPISVMGPGTGLGVALLVGSKTAGWQVIETEGGHVSFAPLGEEEHAIAHWMSARHGRTSNERLLCGAGLSEIHAALAHDEAHPSVTGKTMDLREPADIVADALAGEDLLARRTLARFCAVLGSVAGDTALIHGANSVMIAGGIAPRFIPFLKTSAFRERFLAKGRFAGYLESVSIHVVTHPAPGLLGAAASLHAKTKI
jgi:glucokinase